MCVCLCVFLLFTRLSCTHTHTHWQHNKHNYTHKGCIFDFNVLGLSRLTGRMINCNVLHYIAYTSHAPNLQIFYWNAAAGSSQLDTCNNYRPTHSHTQAHTHTPRLWQPLLGLFRSGLIIAPDNRMYLSAFCICLFISALKYLCICIYMW